MFIGNVVLVSSQFKYCAPLSCVKWTMESLIGFISSQRQKLYRFLLSVSISKKYLRCKEMEIGLIKQNKMSKVLQNNFTFP